MIQQFLHQSQQVFYANIFTLSCQLIEVFTCFLFLRKEKHSLLFLVYGCAAVILVIVDETAWKPWEADYVFFEETGNIIFAFLEFLVFFIYFRHILHSSLAKKAMKLFLILLFSAICFYFFYNLQGIRQDNLILKYSDFLISSELFFLAGLCLVYYLESFHNKNVVSLSRSPSFWIVTSLFLYAILIAPFFMITEAIIEINKKFYRIAYTIHLISFGLIFLSITNGLFMKKNLTA